MLTKALGIFALISSITYASEMNTLNKAIADNNIKKVDQLIKKSGHLNQVDSEGMSPLMLAAAEGNIQVLELILKQNPDLEFKNDVGDTALALAVSSDQEQTAIKLIEAGAKVDVPVYSENGDNLLITAARSNAKVVSLILEKDATLINKKNRLGQTALAESIRFGYLPATQVLLQAGADTTIRNKENQSLEQIAKTYHNPKAVELLKKHKK